MTRGAIQEKLGRTAYEAWADRSLGRGEPYWEDLDGWSRAHWFAVAGAVVRAATKNKERRK